MTPDPWAQAVEAMRDALGGTENWCFQAPCSQCDAEVDKMLRAVLPHLMAAVVEGMTDETAIGIARHIAAANPRPQGMAECATLMRAALLAALTDAADRAAKAERLP